MAVKDCNCLTPGQESNFTAVCPSSAKYILNISGTMKVSPTPNQEPQSQRSCLKSQVKDHQNEKAVRNPATSRDHVPRLKRRVTFALDNPPLSKRTHLDSNTHEKDQEEIEKRTEYSLRNTKSRTSSACYTSGSTESPSTSAPSKAEPPITKKRTEVRKSRRHTTRHKTARPRNKSKTLVETKEQKTWNDNSTQTDNIPGCLPVIQDGAALPRWLRFLKPFLVIKRNMKERQEPRTFSWMLSRSEPWTVTWMLAVSRSDSRNTDSS